MGIFDRFPYSSTHEMNLDFMLGKATEIAEDMQQVTAGMEQVQAGLTAISEKTEQATQAAAQAAQSASSIEGSVTAAEEAAEEAQMHNESAQTWANNAMTYKADCQRSATEAAASSSSAAQAATAAAASEDTVATYAQAANASAQSAANNNDSAHQYANQASASASNATFHSSNAQTAATNANTSATNAETAATNAQTAATRTAALKDDCETLHSMCTTAVDLAAEQAVAAANSAAQAAASKTDAENLVESLPEDFTDLNNTVNQLSDEIDNLSSAFDELNNPQYSGTLLPLVNGTVNSISDDGVINIGTNYTYRVCTKEVLTVSKSLDISIANGFRIYVFKKTPGTSSYSGSGWITGSYNLPTVGTTYVFTIARVTENTSETADIDEFGGAITYSVPLRTARDELNEVEKLSKSIEPLEEGAYDNRHIVKSIAHRGFDSVAPENTIPAFQLAVKKGFRFIETDVMLTSDNVPVCLHDSTINRTARNSDGTELSSTINIYEITYAQAREYDFGIWKGATYAGTKIPTLEEFLVFCRNTGTSPYIELKYYTVWDQATLLNAVTNAVKKCGMSNCVTYISAAQGYLLALIGYSNIKRVGKICAEVTQSEIDNAEALRTNDIESFLDASSVSDAMVTACETAGVPVELYVLNSSADILDANPYVSGITSDSIHAGRVLFSNALN